jgi:LacI family transcriptional regulator
MTMNLKELSAKLGLSQTTVSRALNGYPEVKEETRQRVLAAAERHGYRPSPAARRLATGRAQALGIVFPMEKNILLDPLFIEFLAGVCETAGRHGFDILVSPTTAEQEVATYERLARDGTVDAVIMSSPALDDIRMNRMVYRGFPSVVHGRPADDRSIAYVDIDNEGAFYQAGRFLAQLGHRRIALLNGDEKLTFAADRRAGLVRALAEAAIPPRDDLFFSGPMSVENGYRFARAALSGADMPTAFLCSSILLALGAQRAIAEAGLEVPNDISVIAHDDEMPSFRAEHLHPPMTTTRSSIRAAGARVAEMAIALIEGDQPDGMQEIWPVDLVVRASTAPARERLSPVN